MTQARVTRAPVITNRRFPLVIPPVLPTRARAAAAAAAAAAVAAVCVFRHSSCAKDFLHRHSDGCSDSTADGRAG